MAGVGVNPRDAGRQRGLAKPGLPPIRVVIKEGQTTPSTRAAWLKLWALLLLEKDEAPAPGEDGGECDETKPPKKQ